MCHAARPLPQTSRPSRLLSYVFYRVVMLWVYASGCVREYVSETLSFPPATLLFPGHHD